MGKRSYRSTAFEEMDWSAVLGRIEGARVVLAVDVAKKAFMAQLLDEERDGEVEASAADAGSPAHGGRGRAYDQCRVDGDARVAAELSGASRFRAAKEDPVKPEIWDLTGL